MIATNDIRLRQEEIIARLRQQRWSPAEGWITFVLVTIMAMTLALSADDAAWVLGNPKYGDFYVLAAAGGVAVAFIGAKARWSRWVSHLFGAIVAALVLPTLVGGVLLPDASPYDAFKATSDSVVNAWIDLAVLNRTVTPEIGHFILAIAIIVWSVGQFAGYAVFGHRRPLDAVIVVGIVLLGNMALTINDQLWLLVLFSIGALGVLARTHAFEEQTTWIRRHIGDASTVRTLYVRGGAVFIMVAVMGSLALTASASSAPLAGAWTGFNQRLVDLSQSLQRYLPFGGASRNVGFGFGSQASITGQWSTNHTLQLTINVPPNDTTKPYWRVIAYDHFDLKAWTQRSPDLLDVAPGEEALIGLPDDPRELGTRKEFAYTVKPEGYHGPYAVSPAEPGTLTVGTKIEVVGDGRFASVKLDGDGGYSGVALLPVTGNSPGDRNANALAAAGQDYPSDIKAYYLDVPAGTLGPDARKLLADIKEKAAVDVKGRDVTPYDLALTMQEELQRFKYEADVRGLPCQSLSVVECFARYKMGYCQYYASTMAMLLREEHIPARMVEGFLPGVRDQRTGTEQLYTDGAHAWVEVYFPGFGWQAFDPTGGGRAQVAPLPSGPPVVQTPRPSAGIPSAGPGNPLDDPERGGRTPLPTDQRTDGVNGGLLAAIALILLLSIVAVAFVMWQRGPRGELTPESVWRSVSRLAGRFGFGPRPTQTVYEYAGALGEVLPMARPELQTVARAKVEVAYGKRQLGADRLNALRDAQRRLRVALLRLAFRRRRPRGVRFRGPR